VRWSLLLLFLLLPAMAETLKVLEAERLELREEGGEEVYVLVEAPCVWNGTGRPWRRKEWSTFGESGFYSSRGRCATRTRRAAS
jgi:hypothetical protein